MNAFTSVEAGTPVSAADIGLPAQPLPSETLMGVKASRPVHELDPNWNCARVSTARRIALPEAPRADCARKPETQR